MINILVKAIFTLLILPIIVSAHEPSLCNVTFSLDEQQIEEHFQTKMIQDGELPQYSYGMFFIVTDVFLLIEFIIQFSGYYAASTRFNYLARVFQRHNISNFEIVKRNNIMQSHPSDFDLVRVNDQSI